MSTRWKVFAACVVVSGFGGLAFAAGAHWTAGNVNAVNQLLGQRSGWHFDYVPPPDPDGGLLGTLERYPGLDQRIAIATSQPPDPELGASHPLRIFLPADPTAATRIGWTQPPEPDYPPDPGRALDVTIPADATSPIVIGLSQPPEPDYPPDPGRIELLYPPDPGLPTEITIPTSARVVLRDETGAVLRVCGAVGGGDTAPR